MPHSDSLQRTIFFVSDGTGITAETIGHSLLTQFSGFVFSTQRIPFVDDEEKAHAAVAKIRNAEANHGSRPIVINTVIDPNLAEIIASSGAFMLDVFTPFIAPLEKELAAKRRPRVGQAHGLVDFAQYEQRINATNFALTHDDGLAVNYAQADVILLGVSRSGKTPTCLYMALHYGLRAGNYPLTPDDLETPTLPAMLAAHRHKLYGLTIDPGRLRQVREARKPNSSYASLAQCRQEVETAEKLFKSERIPFLSTTHTSIEEIASKILAALGIDKHLY